MFWESRALMTAVDLAVVLAAAWLAVVAWRNRVRWTSDTGLAGPSLIALGVGLIGLFYAADLATMWVAPHVVGGATAMRWMTELHLNVRWMVSLVSILAIVAGFLRARRDWERTADERDRSLRSLRESEGRYRAIAQNTTDLVAEIEPDGSYVLSSPNYPEVLGYTPEELAGFGDLEILHPEDRERVRAQRDAMFRSGEPLVTTFRMRRGDGHYRWYEASTNRYRAAGGALRAVTITRDITARVQGEEALREAQAQLAQSQKLEAVGRLAGGVAHDFNNHLTVIIGYAEELAKHGGVAQSEEAVEILSAAQKAASLTHRLLSFSRRRPQKPAGVDVNELVGGLGGMLERLIGEDVKFSTRLAPHAGHVRADPGQLERVVMNLVVNARDAMPDGGELSVSTGRVEIGADQERPGVAPGSYVCISVADTGCGMDDEMVSRIFEPFFTTKHEGEGTGLGLSSAYGIVRQSGGDLLVESQPGSGSTFRVLLPRFETAAGAQVGGSDRSPGTAPRHAVILLVDDDAAVRRMVRRTLQEGGHRVVDADGPSQALACWRDAGPVDLLLTDVVMPGMTGVRLYERLREDGCRPRVLFMSGYAKPLGSDADPLPPDAPFLEKPFGARELHQAVADALGSEPGAHSEAWPGERARL